MAQNDRFGNPQVVIGLKDKKGTGYPKGYFEVGAQLFKVTTSPSKKDDVAEWVTITKVNKNNGGNGFGMWRSQGNTAGPAIKRGF